MTQKFKVLVTRKWPKPVEDKLKETFDVKLNENDVSLTQEQLKEAIDNYDALLPTVTDSISNDIISSENRRAKIIGNFGVGFNNIDIESAKKNEVVVTNTPEVLTDCTADIAMLLLLGVARRGSEGEHHVRNKEWQGWRPTHMMGTKVTGKTLGLIGMGRIAQAVAFKAHFGFKMKIIFFDPYFKNKEIIDQGLHLYDSLAVALSFMPEIADFKEAYVSVETKGEFTDGQTVSEFNESIMGQIFKPKPNSEVALDLDVEAFNSLFKERVIGFLVEL